MWLTGAACKTYTTTLRTPPAAPAALLLATPELASPATAAAGVPAAPALPAAPSSAIGGGGSGRGEGRGEKGRGEGETPNTTQY